VKPRYVAAAGMALAVSLTAWGQAAVVTQYVTTAQMERFVVTLFLSGAGVILGGLAIVYGMLDKSKSSEIRTLIKANADQVAENAKSIDKLAAMFAAHHLDADAHPAGSRARIDPINEKLDLLREQQGEIHLNLTALVAEHHEIRRNEANICHVLSNRDPADSQQARRFTDSPDFDGRTKRGKSPASEVTYPRNENGDRRG
jgi:hypothetical protein